MESVTSDDPEENMPQPATATTATTAAASSSSSTTTTASSSGFMNPLELVRREMKLATQSSATRAAVASTAPRKPQSPTAYLSSSNLSSSSNNNNSNHKPVVYSVTSIASDDSSEAEEPVDEQTMREVAMYLDKLTAIQTTTTTTTNLTTTVEEDKVLGMASQDDNESDDDEDSVNSVPVDVQTIQQVGKYLDALLVKKTVPKEATGGSNENEDDEDDDSTFVDEKTIHQVDLVLNALQMKETTAAVRSAQVVKSVEEDNNNKDAAEDDSDNGDDDSSSGHSDALPDNKTLASLVAYIDAVSMAPLPTTVEGTRDMPPWSSAIIKKGTTAPHLDSNKVEGTELDDDAPIAASNNVTIDVPLQATDINQDADYDYDNDDDNVSDGVLPPGALTDITGRVSPVYIRAPKASTIFEQLESMALPRGAHVDPPAVLGGRNADQVDPPAPSPKGNMNDAIMRLHESQAVAPSYSVESLESGGIIPLYRGNMEEEKKQESVETDIDDDILMFRSVSESVDEGGHLPSAQCESDEISVSSELMDEAGVPVRHQLVLPEHSDVNEIRGSQLTGRYDVIEDDAIPETEVEMNDGDTQSEAMDPVASYALPPTPSADSQGEMGIDSVTSELVDEAGVPVRHQLSCDVSDVNDIRGSSLTGRYDMIEARASMDSVLENEDVVTELPMFSANELPHSPSMKDDNSIQAWELKDIASEETMKASGHPRMESIVPSDRSKARTLTSIMSDDSSAANSMVVTEPAGKSGEEPEVDVSFEEGEGGVEIVDTSVMERANDDESFHGVVDDDVSSPVDSKFDEIEDLNEDEAITAFLTRFGTLYKGGHFPDGNVDAVQDYIGTDSGIEEAAAAVEIDVTYGYVNKDLALREQTSQEENGPWWDSLQQDTRKPDAPVKKCMSTDATEGEVVMQKGLAQKSNEQVRAVPDKYVALSSPTMMKVNEAHEAENIGFLQQFDSLGMDSDNETVTADEFVDASIDITNACVIPNTSTSNQSLATLSEIAMYFESIYEQTPTMNTEREHNVTFFQRLVAPLVSGGKPTIIESAQIRQAAMRAEIPIDIVDRFLELVKAGESTEMVLDDDVSSPGDLLVDSKFDEMEDLNEDEAITAFLTRFGTLHKGGHFPDGNADAIQDYIGTDSELEGAAVEIDVEYGFVNKDLVVREQTSHEGNGPWWDSVQKDEKKPDATINTCSSSESKASNGRKFSEADATKPPQAHKNSIRPRREAKLVVNTAYDHEGDREYVFDRRNQMATFGQGWLSPTARFSKPQEINGVTVAENIHRFVCSKSIFKNHRPWRRLYGERTQYHPGFRNIDVYSIYASTTVEPEPDDEEEYIPWEHREVQQRFLHEKSFSFARNWFGDLIPKRGNQKIKAPVCKPKSMEMPMEIVPEPGEWTEEWFTQWKSPAKGRRTSRRTSSDEWSSSEGSYTRSGETMADTRTCCTNTDRGSFTENGGSVATRPDADDTDVGSDPWRPLSEHGSSTNGNRGGASLGLGSGSDSDEESYSSSASSNVSTSWEEAPECGVIINIRQKIGERVTRVHPDYTSSLRRSRWRKKYFPRGTFPY